MTPTKPKEGRALTKERRDVYNRQRRERYRIRKNERRQERETNSYSERRLHFIRVIMAQKHITQAQLAQIMGTTRQAINEVFMVNDDAKLSKVKQMLNACGCSCSVQLSTKETDVVKKKPKPLYEFKGDFEWEESSWLSTPERFISYPESIQNCPPTATLRFLADFIVSSQLNFSSFCELVGISRQRIGYAFTADDISLSLLCRIANRCQATIVWEINNNDSD